jgi:nitrate/TMAO reductase-like tetraheme cytochrome c subunit
VKAPSARGYLALIAALLIFSGAILAAAPRVIAWVQFSAATNSYKLSNGSALNNTDHLEPGQFVAVNGSSVAGLEQWRSPSDIEKRWFSEAGRVNFSHERHFGALGGKNCVTCHADEKGLGKGEEFVSLAPSADLESHATRSTGRFCESCHNGSAKAAQQMEGGQPKLNVTIFTAFGRTGNASCSGCHVPASHGADFAPLHASIVGSSGVNTCTTCHRGGFEISLDALGQAKTFVHAQQQLSKDPQNQGAFSKTLPNQFCAYCHANQRDFFNVK